MKLESHHDFKEAKEEELTFNLMERRGMSVSDTALYDTVNDTLALTACSVGSFENLPKNDTAKNKSGRVCCKDK